MNQTQANRMAALMEMLLNLEDDHRFNMGVWISKMNITSEEEAVDCGTACCAAGWAALIIPSWKRHFEFRGVRLVTRVENEFYSIYDVLGKFLGITFEEANNLFHPAMYTTVKITPHQVVAHIKKVMENYDYELEIS